ncbi:hypothetical protein ABBQ38_007240 [Trebouxia sp. C0009 RCD-2024]
MLPDSRMGSSTVLGSKDRRAKPAVARKAVQTQYAGTAVLETQQPTAQKPSNRLQATDIFVCDEESHFYSQCLEKLLVKNSSGTQTVVEFGSGDGTPVIACLMHSQFSGTIHGFELNKRAADLANSRAVDSQVSKNYKIHNSCFFKGMSDIPASCLIANPPYIPAPDNQILMPALYGGEDGANLTRELMTFGFDSAILLISSYANPVETLEHARKQGYQVTDFMVSPMPFGYYSSEPKVKNWIWKMRAEGKAFCSDNWYLLAGVLLQKRQKSLPSKRKAGAPAESHANGVKSSSNGTSAFTGPSHMLHGTSQGHSANGNSANGHAANGHSANGHSSNGHSSNGHSANGHTSSSAGSDWEVQQQDGLGDCSGLRHRYATDSQGAVNTAEDQLDELIQVMTALR